MRVVPSIDFKGRAVLVRQLLYLEAEEGRPAMPIIKISGQGLMAIAFSVALLWACLIGDRILTQRALVERTRVMRDIRHFQRQPRIAPVAAPVPVRHTHLPSVSAG